MKIKIQNDVIVHQSASLSVNEDVRITIKISNQCFKAVKCEYSAFKVARRQLFLMLTPGPLQRPIFVLAPGPFFVLSAIVQNSFFDRSIVVFKSKSRHNHKVILYDVNQCFKAVKCPHRGHGLQCYAMKSLTLYPPPQ